MRDPHVTSLYYEIRSERNNSFKDPEPLTFSNSLGTFELEGNKLRVSPAEHYAKAAEAQAAVAPFLRAWEIEADLRRGGNVGMIRFRYERADRIDRNPPGPRESITLEVDSVEVGVLAESVTLHLGHRKFPEPPSGFQATVHVEILWSRYIAYLDGKDLLTSMSNFVFTYALNLAGDAKRKERKREVSRMLQIHERVLSKVAELAAGGDSMTARKVTRGRPLAPLTPREEGWLREAIRRLILRIGEMSSDEPLPMLTMADLPKL
jgi:hypothetical protein